MFSPGEVLYVISFNSHNYIKRAACYYHPLLATGNIEADYDMVYTFKFRGRARVHSCLLSWFAWA
jgi:hypothetical protein